jgi:hypothetical protein
MSHRRTLGASGLFVALALTLGGCSALFPFGSTAAHTKTPTGHYTVAGIPVAPATGRLISGKGYSYRVPKGWSHRSPLNFDNPDTDVGAGKEGDGVEVVLSSATKATLSEDEKSAVASLQGAQRTHIQVRPRVKIGGFEAVHLSSQDTAFGVTKWVELYYFQNHAGVGYTVSFDFADTESLAYCDTVADSVFATWAWT